MPGKYDDLLKGLDPKGTDPLIGSYSFDSNLGDSKYDNNYVPFYGNEQAALDYQRADRQSNWDSFGNLLLRGVGKAVLTVPETFGYLADVPEMLHMTDDYDNQLSSLVREKKSWLDDALPEYSRQINTDEFKPQSVEWWFRNGDSVIESLGYLVPGYAVGKGVGAGLKMLKAAKGVQTAGSALSAAVALNYTETMQTAGEFYRRSVKDYLSVLKDPNDPSKGKKYTEEQARQKAAEGASAIVWQGKINIPLELVTTMALFKGFKGLKGSRALAGTNVNEKVGTFLAKELGKQTATEYLEEVSLGYIEANQDRKRNKQLGRQVDESDDITRMLKYLFSDKGLTEGLLGAVGGGVVGSLFVNRQIKDFKEQQRIVKDITGKNNTDLEALVSNLADHNKTSAQAQANRDEIGFDVSQRQKLNEIAAINAYSGTSEQFLDQLEVAAELSTDPDAQTMLREYTQQAEAVEKIVNQVENKYQERTPEFKRLATSYLLNEKTYIDTVNKLNKEINTALTSVALPDTVYSNLNLLYNQKTVIDKLLSQNIPKEYKEYLQNELTEVNNQIELQSPLNYLSDTKKPIESFSVPNVDTIIQPLLDNKYKYDFKAKEAKSNFENIDSQQEQVEQSIQDELTRKKREEVMSDLDKLNKTFQQQPSSQSKEQLKDFEKFKDSMREVGYTEDEIEAQYNELVDVINDKEREETQTPEQVEREEQIDQAQGESLVTTPETVTETTPTEIVEETLQLDIDESSLPEFIPDRTDTVIIEEDFESITFDVRPGPGLASTSEEYKTSKYNDVMYSSVGNPIRSGQESEFDFAYLNSPNGVKVGDQIELYVDSNSKYSLEGKGNTAETVHIKLRVNGKDIGNLKNFRVTGDDIADAKTLEVRTYLFNNPTQTLTTTIAEKTNGFILRSKVNENGKLVPAKNSIKNIQKGIYIPTQTGENVYIKTESGFRGITQEELGMVTMLVETANGQIMPVQIFARDVTPKEALIIAKWVKNNFIPTEVNVNELKELDKIKIEGNSYIFNSVGNSINVATSKGTIQSFPLDAKVYRNNYLNNLPQLENYFYNKKVRFTEDSVVKEGNRYKYSELTDEQLADIITGTKYDINNKTLLFNRKFTSLTGKEYSSYTDFIIENNLYTTDVDVTKPFFGAAVYLNEPGIQTQPVTETIESVEPTITLTPKLPQDMNIEELRALPNTDNTQKALDAFNTINFSTKESIIEGLTKVINITDKEGISKDKYEQILKQKEKLIGNNNYFTKDYIEKYILFSTKEFPTIETIQPVQNVETAVNEVNNGDLFGNVTDLDPDDAPLVFNRSIASQGITQNIPNTAKELLDYAINNAGDSTKSIGKLIKENLSKAEVYINKLDTEVTKDFLNNNGLDVNMAYAENTKSIIIPETALNLDSQTLANTLIHEFTHAYTEFVLFKSSRFPEQMTKEEKQFVNTIEDLYNYSKKYVPEDMYGMTNTSEFLAELSNPLFVKQLEAISRDNRNIFQRIIDAILKLFGINRIATDSVYTEAFNALEKYLKSTSKTGWIQRGTLQYSRIPGTTRSEQKRRTDTINSMFVRSAIRLIQKGPYSLDYLTKAQVNELYNQIKVKLSEDTSGKLKPVLDNWDQFVSESKRSLVDFGFLYKSDDSMELLEIDDTSKESWQIKPFQENVKESLSKAQKLYLRFIEKVDADGNYVKDDIGRNTFVPYNDISTFLIKNLAGLDTHEEMLNKLLNLSNVRPELKRIYTDLSTDKSSQNFKNNFFTNFSKNRTDFVTVLSSGEGETKSSKVIETTRKNLKREVLKEWAVTYQRAVIKDDKVNKDVVDKAYSKLSKLRYKDSVTKEQADIISDSLKQIGIFIDANRFEGMKDADITKYLIGPASINTLFNSLNKGYDVFNVTEDPNTKKETNILNKLSELESNLRYEDIMSSFLNGDFNRVFTIGNDTSLSKTVRRLKRGDLKEFQSDVFYYPDAENVNWGLERLAKDADFREQFKVAVLDSERLDMPGMKGTSYGNMGPLTWGKTQVNSALDQGKKYGWFSLPTPADKENIYIARLSITKIQLVDGKLDETALAMYYRIVMAETARIYKASKELIEWNEDDLIIGYHYDSGTTPRKAKDKALGIVRDNKGEIIPDRIETPVYSGRAFDYHVFTELNQLGFNRKALGTINFVESEKQTIADAINKYFEADVNNILKVWEETGIIKQEDSIYKSLEIDSKIMQEYKLVTNVARNFVFNMHQAYWFMSSVLLGDLAFTKNSEDYTKRIALWQTPGTPIGSGTYNTVIVKDDVIISELANEYKKAFRKLGYTEEQLNSIVGINSDTGKRTGYYKVNGTDAQGLATWERYLDIIVRQGMMTPELEQNIEAMEKGELTPESAKLLFAPVKGTNIGYRLINGKRVPVVVKYSLVPILPSFTKLPKYKKLLKSMQEKGVDELVFESGFKLGQQKLGDWRDSKTWKLIELNNDSYRIPQVVPYKDSGTTLLPTQSMKNIISNINLDGFYKVGDGVITGAEMIQQYQELISSNLVYDANKLIKRLMLDNPGPESNKRLQSVFLSEGRKRNNLTQNQEDALEIVDGDFRVPMSMPWLSSQRQNMYFSLFNKKVATRKVPGFSAVNVSDFATTYSKGKELKFYNVIYDNPTEDQEFTIEAAEVMVSQDYFRNVINKRYKDYNLEGDLTLDKIPEDLRYFIANRIPNQGKNSMIMCKIVGFLPKEAASQIMLPKEGTTQGGYDFDIDKSFILTKNFYIEEGVIKVNKYFSNEEDTNKRYAEYILENNKAIQVRELLREFHEDIAYNEDVVFKLDNALEDKVNNVLGIDRKSITDEEYYDIILDYYSMEELSLEEFSKLNIIEQNTKAARENRIIDTYIGILSSSHNFYESIYPNNVDTLLEIRREIKRITKPAVESKNFITLQYQNNSRELNQAGKQLVGVHSNAAVARAYLQLSNYVSPTSVVFDNKVLNEMGNKVDYSGNLISNNHLELQNASVDNAKEPILGDLNDNMLTANVWNYLTDLGVPLRTVAMFMQQPIMLELTREWNNFGRTRNDVVKAYNKLNDEYGIKIKQKIPKLESVDTNTLTDNLIKNEDPNHLIYQMQILDKFMEYYNDSAEHAKFINAMRADSVRTLPSVIGNRFFMDNYDKYMTDEVELALPMMTEFAEQAVNRPLKLSRNLFVWDSPVLNNLKEVFTETQSDFITEDLATQLYEDYISYLYTLPQSPLFSQVERLNEYLYTRPIANRVLRIQQRERQYFMEDSNYVMNPFIMALSIQNVETKTPTGKELDYQLVVLEDMSASRSDLQKSEIQDGWLEMYQDEKSRDLAIDLFTYSFFINGFNRGSNTLVDYIPVALMEDLGILKYWKNIEDSVKAGDKMGIDPTEFIEKFVRNIKNQGLSPSKKIKKDGNKILNGVVLDLHTIKVSDEFTIGSGLTKSYPMIISMSDKGSTKMFKLSKVENSKNAIYKEINALGTKILREYSQDPQVESIFKDNNRTKEIVELPLDTTVPEIEVENIEPNISDEEAQNRLEECK